MGSGNVSKILQKEAGHGNHWDVFKTASPVAVATCQWPHVAINRRACHDLGTIFAS